jgi:hypothetical protein
VVDLRESKPSLYEALASRHDPQLLRLVADELHGLTRATAKFVRFTMAFLPPPPDRRPGPKFRLSWAKNQMRKNLSTIYDWRSKSLHSGIPLPGPMCEPTVVPDETGVPRETHGSWSFGDAYWSEGDIPMTLEVFAHIVRGALCGWWRSLVAVSHDGES